MSKKPISVANAISLLANNKCAIVAIEAVTTPTDLLNKTNGKRKDSEKVLCVDATGIDPENIRKHTQATIFVGTEVTYEKLVNNRLAKEILGKNADLTPSEAKERADFESAGLPFGEMVDGTHIVHTPKGESEVKHYLRAYFVTANKPITKLYLEGGADLPDLSEEKFAPFRKAPKVEGARQTDAGVEKVIIVRTYGWDSIVGFTMDGTTYSVVR